MISLTCCLAKQLAVADPGGGATAPPPRISMD